MKELTELNDLIKGEVHYDYTFTRLYATDASAYREIPLGVAFPEDEEDLQQIVLWSCRHKIPLIPRAAGTSLAGQVVGNGLVVDTGRYMNAILEIDSVTKTAWVQPGVIRDDLNRALKPFGLHFAPETSTSNRCMMGGMVGNNACGAHSLIYGSTRDHLLEVKGFLSNGDPVHFKPLSDDELHERSSQSNREGSVYGFITKALSDRTLQDSIRMELPWPEIRRRNTGYAIDLLLEMTPFAQNEVPLNLASLIAGSEGTLMMLSAIKLSLTDLPPEGALLLCPHFAELNEAFKANLIALKHPVSSIELIDNVILDCTKDHQGLKGHRFFIEGNPRAVLLIEIHGDDEDALQRTATVIAEEIRNAGFGYHFPVVTGEGIAKVWELRKAGLGLLSNVEGPAKPVPVIEDTAVRPSDLPAYMDDFEEMLRQHGLSCVYYAHIATGELHLRPVLDLKNPRDVALFRTVAEQTALLVKKYRGSLSGEHGDGRLRGEFIPMMVGERIYNCFIELKKVFDPDGLLNPGKITGTPPMDTSLRYMGGYVTPTFTPFFDYKHDGGFLGAVERCNGSGDCRRPYHYGGLMCPSYQASLDERLSTRGRANIIREALSREDGGKPFANPALQEVLDQCLSCKGCKLECPSAVDMARYKAEVMEQYYRQHGTPLHVKLISNIYRINRIFARVPGVYNAAIAIPAVARLIRKMTHIHPERQLPRLSNPTLDTWIRKHKRLLTTPAEPCQGSVVFFVDEFTNHLDADIGIKAIRLLLTLGYRVIPYQGSESGRAAFSKGKLVYARRCARRNIRNLAGKVNQNTPLVGIEPSTLLAFKDEYPDIAGEGLAEVAKEIAKHCYLIEEFLADQVDKGKVNPHAFESRPHHLVFHAHCHQKALVGTSATKKMLEIPEGYTATEIRSGCCGMAGSFGMEIKNYELSMKIGEQVLFPYVRNLGNGTEVAMPGASCRQQLLDGTGRRAYHPVEILYQALKKTSSSID